MPVSHALAPSHAPEAAVGRDQAPGLPEVLAQAAGPRR